MNRDYETNFSELWRDSGNSSNQREWREEQQPKREETRRRPDKRLREAQEEWDRTWGNPKWTEPSRFSEPPPRPE